jgi:Tfp pilus assembly protein PilN
VNLIPPKLGLFLNGDRLVAALIQRGRTETFVVDAEQPAAALQAELSQRQATPRSVAMGLPRGSVTVKPIELPSVDGDEREMVRFELDRHLPWGGDDTPFDYLPLPMDGAQMAEGMIRSVLIAAVDRRVIEGTLRLAEDTKLRPVSITVAAHNLPALVPHHIPGRTVWVHRVGDTAELLFIADSALVLSRSIATSDDTEVAEEIQRSFAVTRWRGCDAVWISGDPSGSRSDALARMGAPASEPPYTEAAQSWLAGLPAESQGELILAVAVAGGGRMRPLELLPPALRPRQITRPQAITLGTAAAVLLLAMGALTAPGCRTSREISSLNRQISQLDPEVRAVEKVVQEVDRKRQLLATIQSIESTGLRPLPVLRELTDLIPADAWLTMMVLDTKGVELTGQAQAAATLIPVLENSPRLERVEFSSPVTRGRDREQFRIRAAWEGGAPPGAAPVAATDGPPAAAPGGRPRRSVSPTAEGPPR